MPSEALLRRVVGEYRELPGLRLTFAQACRLWQLDAATCETVLGRLVRERVLHQTRDGRYVASPAPRPGKVAFDATRPRRSASRHRPMHTSVLLVHGGTDDREMYADYLRDKGFSIVAVDTTEAAVPRMDTTDVVVTELVVAGSLTAVELIQRIRGRWSHADKPIIVVTACVVPDMRIAAERAGCDVVLLKPCLPDMLAAELHRLRPRRLGRASVRRRFES
jgi:CheY-like chemotaxis protein